jgi:hypothetical protein
VTSFSALIPVAQFLLFLTKAYSISLKENWGPYDLAQISLPLVVSIAAEMQRRSEAEMRKQMAAWEGTKYSNKGA